MTGELTIVMYHYVRPLERTRYPAIKGLRLSEFEAQLSYIRQHYTPVTVADLVNCFRSGERLPPRAALLTFDDGFLDHFTYVFPRLHDLGVQGAFFPPVAAVKNGELLDVHRIHFVLASVVDASTLVEEICGGIRQFRGEFGLKSPDEYWSQYGKPGRFDPAEVLYVKRMLQVGLPQPLRSRMTAGLFRKFVSSDEAAFAREIYMDMDQLSMMQRCGMYIGSHGVTHGWLDSLPAAEQKTEIEGSLEFLAECGSPADDWVMSYPFGASDGELRARLRQYGCRFALTTEPAVADLAIADPLQLPRLDTNDLPKTF